MKSVYYWSPFLTHVATISAVIESAKSLRKYSKKYEPVKVDEGVEGTLETLKAQGNRIEKYLLTQEKALTSLLGLLRGM